jgi:hypothetical protein
MVRIYSYKKQAVFKTAHATILNTAKKESVKT